MGPWAMLPLRVASYLLGELLGLDGTRVHFSLWGRLLFLPLSRVGPHFGGSEKMVLLACMASSSASSVLASPLSVFYCLCRLRLFRAWVAPIEWMSVECWTLTFIGQRFYIAVIKVTLLFCVAAIGS